MLYLRTSVKNGIISLHPLNPDEMYGLTSNSVIL